MDDKVRKMWNLYMKVKTDPYKYIGEPDIRKLERFYRGIEAYSGLSEVNLGIWNRLEGFREFLVDGKCAEPGRAYGDASVVRLDSKDSKEAFYRFYEYLEEFLEIQGDSYEPLQVREGVFPTIEGGVTKVIWSIINMDRIYIWMGEISLSAMEPFISGVIHCAELFENKQFELLPGFAEYLRERFSEREEMNYYQIIQRNSINDEEAFRNFYAWTQDFIKEKGSDYEPVVEKVSD